MKAHLFSTLFSVLTFSAFGQVVCDGLTPSCLVTISSKTMNNGNIQLSVKDGTSTTDPNNWHTLDQIVPLPPATPLPTAYFWPMWVTGDGNFVQKPRTNVPATYQLNYNYARNTKHSAVGFFSEIYANSADPSFLPITVNSGGVFTGTNTPTAFRNEIDPNFRVDIFAQSEFRYKYRSVLALSYPVSDANEVNALYLFYGKFSDAQGNATPSTDYLRFDPSSGSGLDPNYFIDNTKSEDLTTAFPFTSWTGFSAVNGKYPRFLSYKLKGVIPDLLPPTNTGATELRVFPVLKLGPNQPAVTADKAHLILITVGSQPLPTPERTVLLGKLSTILGSNSPNLDVLANGRIIRGIQELVNPMVTSLDPNELHLTKICPISGGSKYLIQGSMTVCNEGLARETCEWIKLKASGLGHFSNLIFDNQSFGTSTNCGGICTSCCAGPGNCANSAPNEWQIMMSALLDIEKSPCHTLTFSLETDLAGVQSIVDSYGTGVNQPLQITVRFMGSGSTLFEHPSDLSYSADVKKQIDAVKRCGIVAAFSCENNSKCNENMLPVEPSFCWIWCLLAVILAIIALFFWKKFKK